MKLNWNMFRHAMSGGIPAAQMGGGGINASLIAAHATFFLHGVGAVKQASVQ